MGLESGADALVGDFRLGLGFAGDPGLMEGNERVGSILGKACGGESDAVN